MILTNVRNYSLDDKALLDLNGVIVNLTCQTQWLNNFSCASIIWSYRIFKDIIISMRILIKQAQSNLSEH